MTKETSTNILSSIKRSNSKRFGAETDYDYNMNLIDGIEGFSGILNVNYVIPFEDDFTTGEYCESICNLLEEKGYHCNCKYENSGIGFAVIDLLIADFYESFRMLRKSSDGEKFNLRRLVYFNR